MPAVPRPRRDPVVGEIIAYFPNGDPDERWEAFHVLKCVNGFVDGYFYVMGSPVPRFKYNVRHVHDEYWDRAQSAPELLVMRRQNGSYDLHPTWGPMTTKVLGVANARAGLGKREFETAEAS